MPAARPAAVTLALLAGLALGAPPAAADDPQRLAPDMPEPEPTLTVPLQVDTRWVQHNGQSDEPQVVYETLLMAPGAAHVRFFFGEVDLAGDLELGRGTVIRLTSLHDGAQQTLSARHLAHWQNSTATFRGDIVRLEVIAHPHTGPSRLTVTEAVAGIGAAGADTICGPEDDRRPTTDRHGAMEQRMHHLAVRRSQLHGEHSRALPAERRRSGVVQRAPFDRQRQLGSARSAGPVSDRPVVDAK